MNKLIDMAITHLTNDFDKLDYQIQKSIVGRDIPDKTEVDTGCVNGCVAEAIRSLHTYYTPIVIKRGFFGNIISKSGGELILDEPNYLAHLKVHSIKEYHENIERAEWMAEGRAKWALMQVKALSKVQSDIP